MAQNQKNKRNQPADSRTNRPDDGGGEMKNVTASKGRTSADGREEELSTEKTTGSKRRSESDSDRSDSRKGNQNPKKGNF